MPLNNFTILKKRLTFRLIFSDLKIYYVRMEKFMKTFESMKTNLIFQRQKMKAILKTVTDFHVKNQIR